MGKISRAAGVSDARTGEGLPNEVEYTDDGAERVRPGAGPVRARGAHPDDELRQDYAHQVTPDGRGVEVHEGYSVLTDAADGNKRHVVEHGTDDGEGVQETVPGAQVGHDPLVNVPEGDEARNANRDERHDPYASMSYAELQADCKTRTPALSAKGDREELIARLREDDERRAGEGTASGLPEGDETS